MVPTSLSHLNGVSLLLICGLCLLPLGVLADTQYLTDDEGVPVEDTLIVPKPDTSWEDVAEIYIISIVVMGIVMFVASTSRSLSLYLACHRA